MADAPAVPPLVNRMMKFMLRSPLHAVVSKSILLISFTGRKSGKFYSTPVSYSQTGDEITIFTHARWWKNLDGRTPVRLRLRGREVTGLAEPIVTDKAAIASALGEHLRQVRADAPFYAVSFDEQGNPRPEDLDKAAQTAVMVRVRLG